MQRIRIIFWSVKLRVLNPKLQNQRYIREIKKRHITDKARKHHRECLLLLARKWSFRHQRRYALSHQSFRVSVSVVYFVAGVRWMLGFCFFRVCCSRFAIVYHHHFHHHHLSSSACGIERNYILFSFRDSVRLSSSRVR